MRVGVRVGDGGLATRCELETVCRGEGEATDARAEHGGHSPAHLVSIAIVGIVGIGSI